MPKSAGWPSNRCHRCSCTPTAEVTLINCRRRTARPWPACNWPSAIWSLPNQGSQKCWCSGSVKPRARRCAVADGRPRHRFASNLTSNDRKESIQQPGSGRHRRRNRTDGGERGYLGRGESASAALTSSTTSGSMSASCATTITSIHATKLVAEWPVRSRHPRPGPAGRRLLRRRRPGLRARENIEGTRRLPSGTRDRRLPAHHRGGPATSRPPRWRACRCCPGDVTTGVLGFVKFGDREWTPEELNALKAIASLFAQLQARMLAEEQLRFLAEHDDLTGLHNRRALLAHLDAATGRRTAGPGLGLVPRPGPAQGDQRLPRPYRRRLVHPRLRRTAARRRRRPQPDRPARRRRVRRRTGGADVTPTPPRRWPIGCRRRCANGWPSTARC